MAFFDYSLDELEKYRPQRQEPADFDSFWQQTLDEARQFPLDAQFMPYACGIRTLDVYDLTFRGYANQPIKGWFMLPRNRSQQLPCVIEFLGYGSGRATPFNWLTFPSAGYAYLLMDTRGQGSAYIHGDTPDPEIDGGNPQYPGFMTRGIMHPETYYYRRVYTDAVRAVEAARSHPAVDPQKIALTGTSQGGGITLAASSLVPDIALAMPNVPFLCNFRRSTQITDTHPYFEIAQYCRVHRDQIDTVFNTLAYFDGMNFAARANAKAMFSTALMDDVCPPSGVFAAYNHYAGEKEIITYEYNLHEGGGLFQVLQQVALLQKTWPME